MKLKLAEVLARFDITSNELAEQMQVHRSTVSDWKTGRANPKLSSVQGIRDAIEYLRPIGFERKPLSVGDILEWGTSDEN